ncbi:MAG: hypothetical protein H7246_07445 [Phycisphaerae bacterium]|nr:hypothetical protein [Saprospiraceae bacterium]
MENLENDMPQELTENAENQGLWLTERLLEQLRNSARVGMPLMLLCMVVGIAVAALSVLSQLWFWMQRQKGDFYLLEGGNLYRLLNLLLISAIVYCFARAVIEGYKSWKLLKYSQTDDDALLEGTERLSKMFRWLTFWGVLYLAYPILGKVWSAFVALLARPTQF